AAGKTVRDVERMVSGHKPGDSPDDPPDPALIRRVMRYEVRAETYALLREARRRVEEELNQPVDDDQFLAELARGILAGAGDTGRATHQIAINVCERCQRTTQDC